MTRENIIMELEDLLYNNGKEVQYYAREYNACGEFDYITEVFEDFEDLYFQDMEHCALAVANGEYRYTADYYTLGGYGEVISMTEKEFDIYCNVAVAELIECIIEDSAMLKEFGYIVK